MVLGATWVGSLCRKFLGEERTLHKEKMIKCWSQPSCLGNNFLGENGQNLTHKLHFCPNNLRNSKSLSPWATYKPHLSEEVAPYGKFISPQGIWLRLPFGLLLLGKSSFFPKEVLPWGTWLGLPLSPLLLRDVISWKQLVWKNCPWDFFFSSNSSKKIKENLKKDPTVNLWVKGRDSNHYIFFLETIMQKR